MNVVCLFDLAAYENGRLDFRVSLSEFEKEMLRGSFPGRPTMDGLAGAIADAVDDVITRGVRRRHVDRLVARGAIEIGRAEDEHRGSHA